MASIDRTAYPRFRKKFTDKELEQIFQPDEQELYFVSKNAKGERQCFTLLVLLKCYQYLGYNPSIDSIPEQSQDYLRTRLDFSLEIKILDANTDNKTFYRYKDAIRSYLNIKPYNEGGEEIIKSRVEKAAYTMSDPADLINVAIENLIEQRFELPAFSTLDRLVGNIRQNVHEKIYNQITASLTEQQCQTLDELLQVQEGERITKFTKLKQTPGIPTLKQMNIWTEHVDWLESIIQTEEFLRGIAHTKIRQFAAEVRAFEVGDMLDIQNPSKRYALLIAFIHQTQVHARDQLVIMLLKRMKRTNNNAQERLQLLQTKHREIEEHMMEAFSHVTKLAASEDNNEILGREVRNILKNYGGIENLIEQYNLVSAYHNNNYLPLLWDIHKQHRSALFRLTHLLDINSATQDKTVINALHFIQSYQNAKRDYLPYDIDIEFASNRWKSFIKTKNKGEIVLKRRELELCVFSYIADGLRCNDLFVTGSQEYADSRQQFLSWEDCQPRLGPYCEALQLPDRPDKFVEHLRKQLSEAAQKADATYADNTELTIDAEGKAHLKKTKTTIVPEEIEHFKEAVRARMPEHHLLDILKQVQYWTNYTRHFHPPSGSDSKMADAVSRYLFTVFGYGCNLGPAQTARHIQQEGVTLRTLKRINDQHITTEKLENALRDVINEYTRFELPFLWGTGNAAIADGTHIELIENNLLGERHIRYGGYGGIAYHHISDTYIALFSHFIACGVWEAVFILDGLLENISALHPDTVYADTQGQCEPAFAFAYLLGIKLMPQMRNWNDVIFYRPDKQTTYKHIDALFTETVNWELIQTHWQDLMQVVLSIQAGKILPSTLLQKLGVYSHKNKLYQAFRELGRVARTIFLLEYITNKPLRKIIKAETTKIETFNNFGDWISFGGNILTSGDPVEQEKRIKYMNLVANVLMLHNVVDITEVLNTMTLEGYIIRPEMVERLSPYMTEHIKRFGQYILNIEPEPEPLK